MKMRAILMRKPEWCHQYLLSLIGALGEGRCFYKRSIIGLALLFFRLGSYYKLLEIYLLDLSP